MYWQIFRREKCCKKVEGVSTLFQQIFYSKNMNQWNCLKNLFTRALHTCAKNSLWKYVFLYENIKTVTDFNNDIVDISYKYKNLKVSKCKNK